MDLRKLNKTQLVHLLELQELCVFASSHPDDLQSVLSKLKLLIPFDAAVLATFDQRVQVQQKNLHNFGLKQEFIDQYFERNLQNSDPIREFFVNSGERILSREEVYQRVKHIRRYRPFLQLCDEFGYHKGIAAIAQEVSAEKNTYLSIAMNRQPVSHIHREILAYSIPHIHAALSRGAPCDGAPKLTPKETAVLKWCHAGKKSEQIAEILCCTERTVRFHLSNVFQKLEASNRAQAVAKGLQYGLIEL